MHAKACDAAGAKVVFIKTPAELSLIDGLILPGGESTVMLKHFEQNPLWWDAFAAFHHKKKPIFGTCAGLILLAKTVTPAQKSLGFLDVAVTRNAYGRQIDSHTLPAPLTLNGKTQQVLLPFIRAPKITSVGREVSVLAQVDAEIVIVEQGHILGATCHPEATTSIVHAYFISRCIA